MVKALMAVDGSAGSLAAAAFAGRLLTAAADTAVLYYTPPAMQTGSAEPAVVERARRALADAVFQEAKTQLPKALAEHAQTIVGTRPPRQGIHLAAGEVQADLIVVGARGIGPIAKLLLGSVSQAVVREATLPVLVVRATTDRIASQPPRVLWACDGSPGSTQAASVLKKISWPHGTVCQVMSVMEPLLAGKVPDWLEKKARDADSEAMAQTWVAGHEAELRERHDLLVALCRELPPALCVSDPLVVEGHAAEQILATAAVESTTLLVVGAHGKGALERLIIGSTSEALLAHAECSVLVVRQRPQP